MKFIFTFLLSFFSILSYSQKRNITLTYDIQLLFTKEIFFQGILNSDGKRAVFECIPKSDLNTNFSKNLIITDNSMTYELVKDFKQNSLVIMEDHPVILWEITDDSQIISGFECFKATASFAGRNYIAWFTNEIPIFHGVFRLHGLPGAIIKLVDDTQEISVILNKIQERNEINYDNEINKITSLNKIERKEYIHQIKIKIEELSNKLKATQQEGFTADVKIKEIKMIEMPE